MALSTLRRFHRLCQAVNFRRLIIEKTVVRDQSKNRISIPYRTSRTPHLSATAEEGQSQLTVIVAMKYNNGIVMYSDTKENVPRESGSYSGDPSAVKLRTLIDSRYAIGCSGIPGDIADFVYYFDSEFASVVKDGLLSDDELYKTLQQIITNFCEYLKNKSLKAYGAPNKIKFDVEALLAAPLRVDKPLADNEGFKKFGLYRMGIYFTGKDVVDEPSDARNFSVIPRDFHDCIGTGRDVARTWLTIIEAFVKSKGGKFYKLSRPSCAIISHLITALTFKIDITVGGAVHAYDVTGNGAKPLSQSEYYRGNGTLGDFIHRAIQHCSKDLGISMEGGSGSVPSATGTGSL